MSDREKIEAIWKPLENGSTNEIELLLREGVNINTVEPWVGKTPPLLTCITPTIK